MGRIEEIIEAASGRPVIVAYQSATVIYVKAPDEPPPVVEASQHATVVVFDSCEPGIQEAVTQAIADAATAREDGAVRARRRLGS